MLNKSVIPIAVIFIALSAQAHQASANPGLEAGAWEMHTTIAMKDAKTGQDRILNNTTVKQCFSPEYVAQNPYLTPNVDKLKMEKKQATCSITDATLSANVASWKMGCKTLDGHLVKVSINNAVSARQVQSNADQEVTKDGKSVFAKIKVLAKHIGECTDGMPKL